LDPLLYFHPKQLLHNILITKITNVHYHGNLYIQLLQGYRNVHKTQVIMDHIKITSLKSLSVGMGAITTFNTLSHCTYL